MGTIRTRTRRLLAIGATTTFTAATAVGAAIAVGAPVSTFYSPFVYAGPGASATTNFLQGIKGSDTPGAYLIVGTTGKTNNGGHGVVYDGPIDAGSTAAGSGSGTWTMMDVPSGFGAVATSIYGVNNLAGSTVELVGTYTKAPGAGKKQGPTVGFFYRGPVTAAPAAAHFVRVRAHGVNRGIPAGADETYLHSVDGAGGTGPVAGNYDFFSEGSPAGHAFLWNPITHRQTDIRYRDSARSHTAYGIWSNGASRWAGDHATYTIAGGEGIPGLRTRITGQFGESLGLATLIDYDARTGRFLHLQRYRYENRTAFVTHFEGIYYIGHGLYQLPFTAATAATKTVAGLAYVRRRANGTFAPVARWYTFAPTGIGGTIGTNDSTYGKASIGLVTAGSPTTYASLTSGR